MHTETLLHHIASTPGVPVNLTTDSSCMADLIPDPHVLCAYVDGVSPPNPFLSCTQNIGSSKEDQEGEDGDRGSARLSAGPPKVTVHQRE